MLLIRRPLKKRKRLSLTPLIDVIFILVMFFLLSSTFGVWRPLDISLRRGEQPQQADKIDGVKTPSILVTIRFVGEIRELRIEVNGIGVRGEELVAELDRLSALGATDALLVPADDIEFQDVVRILDLARESRISQIGLKVD